MLQHRDVPAGCSLLLLHISNKLMITTIFTCNAQKTQEIRYRAIMHLLIYKIELKRSKDAGMT